MAELVDIVNEQDEVIGQAERNHAKANGLLYRYINVFIENSKGELVLQVRGWKPNSRGAMMFDATAGGAVDAGEDYETAAHRELQEEASIDTELSYMFEISDRGVSMPNQQIRGKAFIGYHDGPYVPEEGKVEKFVAFSPDELRFMLKKCSHMFLDAIIPILEKYLESK